MAEISPLRRRMIEDMTVRNLSPTTQQSYLNAVTKLSRYFGRSPDQPRPGRCPCLPGSSGCDGDILASAEPDRLRAAVFLRCDPWS